MEPNHVVRISVFATVISLLILTSCSQKGMIKIDRRHSIQIESEALGETRDIFIHLPEGYERSEKRYPVLYVLDAEDVFSYAVGAVDFLSTARMPEMIVVGIPNTNRERDLWVNLEPDGGYIRFVEFLEKELIPAIDASYRTQPYRVFYGFCSGAGTVFWILFTRPEMFDGYIAAGTGYNQTWVDLGKQAFEKHPSLKKSLFAVTEGTTPRAQGMPLLRSLLETSAPVGLKWECMIMEGEEHGPVAAKGLFAGLRFIFNSWRLPVNVAARGSVAIKKYYEKLSRDYGFEIGIPEQSVLSAASLLFWQGKRKKSTEIFQFMTEQYPLSTDAFELLGLAHEEENQLELAKEAYEAAVRNAKRTADRRLPMFEEYVVNIKSKMVGGENN